MGGYYNTLKIAGSSQGHKHTEEAITKIKVASIKNQPTRVKVEVKNTTDGKVVAYDSARLAAKALGVSAPTITARLNGLSESLVLNMYEIRAVESTLSPASKHSDETRAEMSVSQKSRFSSSEARDALMLAAISRIGIKVTDLKSGTTEDYASIRQAARELGLLSDGITKYIRNGGTKPFKGRYIIKVLPKTN